MASFNTINENMFPLAMDSDEEQMEYVDKILEEDLMVDGVHSAIVIDRSGNLVTKVENGTNDFDLYSLAALASANFAAVETMAQILGEEEFSLLFHKGENESIHFNRISEEHLLIILFGKGISLGLLRLRIEHAIEKIRQLLDNV